MTKLDLVPEQPDHPKWLLLLLPALLVVANSDWFYNAPKSIDPWVYFGYFLHLVEFKSSLFPDLYYGSRLTWILPGYLAYRFFDATVARYVLHLAFYYVATFSIYAVLKQAFGRRNGLLGTVVFGTHAALLVSIGWDYVDGAGLAYNLLALACMSRATVARPRQLWLVFAGMASMAMFYTNLFLVVFLPLQLAFYLFLTATGFNRSLIRSTTTLLWFAGGAALLSVVLGAVNYRLDGNFWFYAPSISAFRSLASSPSPWRVDGLTWIRKAHWLVIPAAAVCACIASAIRSWLRGNLGWRDHQTFFIWQYLASVAIMVVWYGIGGAGLQLSYYVSYLLPSMFLAIGGLLAVPAGGWRPYAWWPVVLGSTLAFAVALRLNGGPLSQSLRDIGPAAMVACTTAALLSRALFPGTWQTIVPALAGLVLYQLTYPEFVYPRLNGEITERVVQAVRAAWPSMQKGTTVFWYDQAEPYGLEFSDINAAYLWSYSFVSQTFPFLDDTRPVKSGQTVLVMSRYGQALERADRTLRLQHLRSSLVETHNIKAGSVAYDLTVLTIHDDLPNLQTLKVVRRGATVDLTPASLDDDTQLPWSGWTGGRMEQRPEGLLVTTGPEQFAVGSRYAPLVAPISGRYQFTLTYKVFEGRILFAGLTADLTRALGRALIPAPAGGVQTVTFVAQLKAGEGIALLIGNDTANAGARARYLIESVRVAASFDDEGRVARRLESKTAGSGTGGRSH